MKHGLIGATCLLALVYSSCNERNALVKKVSKETVVTSTDDIGDIPPPGADIAKKPIVKIDAWFAKISQQNKTDRDARYVFSLFESDRYFAVYCKDTNDTTLSPSDSANYSLLAKDDYKGLSAFSDAIHKMQKQIGELAATPQFRASPLARARSVTIRFDDHSSIRLK